MIYINFLISFANIMKLGGLQKRIKISFSFTLFKVVCVSFFFLKFAVMTSYKTAVLDNGLRIIALPTASPVVYCGYQLNVGDC